MKFEDLLQIQKTLEDSFAWEPEVLEKMPKLFLLLREKYMRSVSAERKTTATSPA